MQLAARSGAALLAWMGSPADPRDHATTTPLSGTDFAARMAQFAPFEPAPTIAVGVSGGRDSMSLALLAARWATQRGGNVVAITVDHGLRPESAWEARQVGDWLAAHGIRHHILRWPGPYPASGIQAAARQARYRLLSEYCRDRAILHLLVAHQREDQAETVWLRRERASGRHGLAAMAAISELRHVRLLRPLLDVPRARLAATLDAVDQPWIDDPSNLDSNMARGRLRSEVAHGSVAGALAIAAASADERLAAERAAAALAARALRFHQAGFITVDRSVLTAGAPEIVDHVLARAVMAVAGRTYPPRGERTQRLREAMSSSDDFRSRTLGGCRLVGQANWIHICREPARIGPSVPLQTGTDELWDNRYLVSVTKNLGEETRLDALTAAGWNQIVGCDPGLRESTLPYAARVVLPAVWHGDQVLAVPHLAYGDRVNPPFTAGLQLKWRPPLAVAPARFGKV